MALKDVSAQAVFFRLGDYLVVTVGLSLPDRVVSQCLVGLGEERGDGGGGAAGFVGDALGGVAGEAGGGANTREANR